MHTHKFFISLIQFFLLFSLFDIVFDGDVVRTTFSFSSSIFFPLSYSTLYTLLLSFQFILRGLFGEK